MRNPFRSRRVDALEQDVARLYTALSTRNQMLDRLIPTAEKLAAIADRTVTEYSTDRSKWLPDDPTQQIRDWDHPMADEGNPTALGGISDEMHPEYSLDRPTIAQANGVANDALVQAQEAMRVATNCAKLLNLAGIDPRRDDGPDLSEEL